MNTNTTTNDIRELTADETDGVSGAILSKIVDFVLDKVFQAYVDSVSTGLKPTFQHIKDVRDGKKPA